MIREREREGEREREREREGERERDYLRISSFLGEMFLMSGCVRVSGSIAYAPQQPWLQNMTMRENITFGKKFDKRVYNKVLRIIYLNSRQKFTNFA